MRTLVPKGGILRHEKIIIFHRILWDVIMHTLDTCFWPQSPQIWDSESVPASVDITFFLYLLQRKRPACQNFPPFWSRNFIKIFWILLYNFDKFFPLRCGWPVQLCDSECGLLVSDTQTRPRDSVSLPNMRHTGVTQTKRWANPNFYYSI